MSKEAEDSKDRPRRRAVSRVIKQNIRAILHQRAETARLRSLEDRIADVITGISGHMIFVYVHIVWFSVWFLINTGLIGIKPFDPFPYGLLTMIVSLEAIFLSTFVLISQNRMSEENEDRAELDLQINLLTERELTHVLQMLDEVQNHLGIQNNKDRELDDMEKETRPEDVLNEIQRDHRRWLKRK